MNRLAQHLAQQLERHISGHRVAVWYDPRREWVSAFPDFTAEGKSLADLPIDALGSVTIGVVTAQFAIFTGSYLQLRLLSEQVAASETPQPLVLYLPGESPDEENSVLMELEIGGKRWVPPLKRLAREVLKPYYVDGKIDELLEVASLTYADAVGWLEQAEEQAVGFGSMLKLVFPGLESAERILVEWLIHADRDTEIEEKNAVSELRAHLAHRLGLGLPDSISLAEARERTWRNLLVTEFRADLRCQPPGSLSLFPTPSTEGQMKTIRLLLSSLRREHATLYKSRADQIERELLLHHAGVAAADLGSIDTFRFEERALLSWCDRLLVEGRHEEAGDILRARGNSFWVDQDLARKAQWAVCSHLVELVAKVEKVGREVGGPTRPAAAWVEAYTRPDGWWEIDQIHRQLDTLVAGLDEEPELGAAIAFVRQKYESVLQKMAEGFTDAVKQNGWQIEGAQLQHSVFAQHVASAGTPVAYFLVDAMRYEMAQELAQQLTSSASVLVRPAIAAIPTITKIGMAALLPGASGSFTVTEEKGRLGARVDGSFLPDWSARKKYWKARNPDLVEMELGAVLELTPRKLLTKVTGAPMLLVRSSEIDELGESGQSHIARQVMATVLGNLVRAIRKLAAAGIPRFVVAADHGYQFVDEKGDEMKTDSPGGQDVELHRRCWAGRGGQNPPGTVRVSSAELGYEGSLEFVFPTGLGVFKAGGDLAYHHGGISLQELVVPVVTVRVDTARSQPPPARKVSVSGVPSVLTTRTLGVKLALDVDGLFETGEPLEIRPVLVAGGREVGKAGLAVGADLDLNTQSLRLAPGQEVMVGLLLEQEDATKLRVAVLDPKTGVVLGESDEIEVKFGI